MANRGRFLGVALALAFGGAGGCALVYSYGDYHDQPGAGGGGASSSSGCTLPVDMKGDCQKPICADGAPATALDDTDVPDSSDPCVLYECHEGVPTLVNAPDNNSCDTGKCLAGACVACIDAADCGGKCCLIGNVCGTASPSCTDQCQDGDETDSDCGGSCAAKCDNGKGCRLRMDCASGFCDDTDHCAPCADLTDCGGAGCCNSGVCGPCTP
ncbi:MAG: hypothetical protein QM820_19250 [Minicystis sp.]